MDFLTLNLIRSIDNILRYLYNKIKEGTLVYLLKEIKAWKKVIMI
jgi:hypothetical protein